MPKFCKICNRPKEKNHECKMVTLSDGRSVHATRVDNYDGDIREQIDKGEVKVEYRWKPEPLRKISELFGASERNA